MQRTAEKGFIDNSRTIRFKKPKKKSRYKPGLSDISKN
ncbi:hypothetical protein FEDK69T_11570 [Flavobacterium enshiense DK69]|nr:hypothetical protein FEDK69T_11570 [Flavobacterium enshiense DK69]